MLPRFNSEENEKMKLLPRFRSEQISENQSAEIETNDRLKTIQIKFLERVYDRSGKKCWPLVNASIAKFDLKRTYDIVGNSLESYINYRKLNRCKALANFIEYRDKIYKREKIAQPTKEIKEIPLKKSIDVPTKTIQIEENSSSSTKLPESHPIPSTESLISDKSPSIQSISLESSIKLPSPPSSPNLQIPEKPTLSPKTILKHSLSPKKQTPKRSSPSPSPQISTPNHSSANNEEAIIPIPSPSLLRKPPSKQNKLTVPMKMKSNLKQSSKDRSRTNSKKPLKTTTKPCVIL